MNVREVGAGPGPIGNQPLSLVGPTEVEARDGTSYQIPIPTQLAEGNVVAPPPGVTRTGSDGWYIFELVFQGQAADVPITLGVVNAVDHQWGVKKNQAGGTPPPAPTYTPVTFAAGAPVATLGDYEGTQGSPQYDASIAMTSAGSMVSAYTSEPVLSAPIGLDNVPLPSDSNLDLNGYDDTGDVQNIYAEPLEETTDTAGPHVVSFTDGNGVDLMPDSNGEVNNGTATATGVNATHLVLTFDEPMFSPNPVQYADSVYNASNYEIYNSAGTLMSGIITQVNYGLSEVAQMSETSGFGTNANSAIPDNKWEVVLTLDDAANAANGGALPDGTYELLVRNAEPANSASAGQTGLCNIYGTPLNLTGYNPAGSDFTASITISKSTNPGGNPVPPGLTATDTPINSVRGGLQTDPAMATGATGNYVIVWTSDIKGQSKIVGQLYNSSGTMLGAEFTVNTAGYTSCSDPDVGMDQNGNFVVTWSGVGPNSNAQTEPSDVFVRQYNAQAEATDDPFQVDLWVAGLQEPGIQNDARVAVSPDGTFIVTWTSTPVGQVNSNAENAVVFAREFTSLGVPVANEFQLTASSVNAQELSDVAIDSKDDFAIVWENAAGGVYGAYFKNTGSTSAPAWGPGSETGPVLLNSTSNGSGNFAGSGVIDLNDTGPRVAMVPATASTSAEVVVTWSNFSSSTSTGYNVYARLFNTSLSGVGSAFMVDQIQPQPNTEGWQVMPAVGVDGQGHITIAWTSYGQDNAEVGNPGITDYGIYARIYNANGSDYYDTALAFYPKEFRVNATTLGNQVAPAVAANDPNDDAFIAWVGPDTKAAGTTAIYLRVIDPPPAEQTVNNPSKPVVTTSPANQTIMVGGTTSFTAAANANPAATVKWYVNTGSGFTALSNSGVYSGVTTPTLTIAAATAAQSGYQYHAVFTNTMGSATTMAATLTVDTPPKVTTNPTSKTVKAGGKTTFLAAASGNPAATVQWYVNTGSGFTALSVGNGYSGVTTTTLTITGCSRHSRAIRTRPSLPTSLARRPQRPPH